MWRSNRVKNQSSYRGVSSYSKMVGQVVMRRAAAARRRLLFCQNLGGQLPTLPTCHWHPCSIRSSDLLPSFLFSSSLLFRYKGDTISRAARARVCRCCCCHCMLSTSITLWPSNQQCSTFNFLRSSSYNFISSYLPLRNWLGMTTHNKACNICDLDKVMTTHYM